MWIRLKYKSGKEETINTQHISSFYPGIYDNSTSIEMHGRLGKATFDITYEKMNELVGALPAP